MNDVEKRLRSAWNKINNYGAGTVHPGSLQLGINHPLDWHVTLETPTNKALVIISAIPADPLESSKCIKTACRKREDELFYIAFQLTDLTQEDVFINMCSNLIEYSSSASSEEDAIKRVVLRYKQWRKLMEHRNSAILSDSKRKGLIGELLYLEQMIGEKTNCREALAGWVGPDGADQDFVYDKRWREVKTTGLSSDSVSIHSLEQLGNGDEDGELIIYRVDSCAPEADGAFTLRILFKRIMALFGGDIDLEDEFISKLATVGYIDMEEYEKYPYKFFNNEVFFVDKSFPRIRRENVSPAIVNCEYSLSIPGIDYWKRR